jgi:hypothetical protein
MPYYRGYAPVRKTEVGTLIESFMDDNHENLSPELWEKLDALGKEVDEMVEALEGHIDELNSQIVD